MKKNKYILGILAVLFAMTSLYSCKDDAAVYEPAEKLDSEQVYFPSTNASTIELSSVENSYDIVIARVKTDNAITVPLTITGNSGVYDIPSSVNFAQGESTASVKVTYDVEEIGFDTFSDLIIGINEEYTSEYGNSKYSFNIGIPAPWKSLGEATYFDDLLNAFYGTGIPEYKIEIQENLLQPGLFRLVNPYGEAYPHNDPGDWDDSQDWYFEINAVDPTAVYINVQEVGMDWGDGMLSFGSVAGLQMSRDGKTLEEVKEAGLTGTFENGVITFPVGSLVISEAGYNDGALYGTNGNGAFMVIMPGTVLSDYSIEVNYIGRYINLKDSSYVVADVTLGEDVESAKLALVANDSSNPVLLDDIVEGMDDGSIEAIDIDKSGSYNLPNEVDGDYLLVAVSYDENGEIKEVDYDAFSYAVDSVTDKITNLSTISLRSSKIDSNKNIKQLKKNLQGAMIFR
jgi:hypothetical protein